MEEKDDHHKRIPNLVVVDIPVSGNDRMEERNERDVKRVIEVKSSGSDEGEMK